MLTFKLYSKHESYSLKIKNKTAKVKKAKLAKST